MPIQKRPRDSLSKQPKAKTQATEEQRIKRNFRQTVGWKKFRAYLKKTRKVDAVTGAKLTPKFELHHCDLNFNHYTDISDETHFECLNNMTHDFIHWGLRYYEADGQEFIKRMTDIWDKMIKLSRTDQAVPTDQDV